MIEVELKFAVPARTLPLLHASLAALPAIYQPEHDAGLDVYYDTTSFVALRQAVFLRIRNRSRLELKYHESADPEHVQSTERVFPLTATTEQMQALNALCADFFPGWLPAETIPEALRRNALREFVRIAKRRTRYVYQHMILCVDQVDGLGDFFEVETSCEQEAEVELALASLQTFIRDLALPGIRPVTIGYVELWLRLHLPQVYRLGKYQEVISSEQGSIHEAEHGVRDKAGSME